MLVHTAKPSAATASRLVIFGNPTTSGLTEALGHESSYFVTLSIRSHNANGMVFGLRQQRCG